jgi:hypothetical protein
VSLVRLGVFTDRDLDRYLIAFRLDCHPIQRQSFSERLIPDIRINNLDLSGPFISPHADGFKEVRPVLPFDFNVHFILPPIYLLLLEQLQDARPT